MQWCYLVVGQLSQERKTKMHDSLEIELAYESNGYCMDCGHECHCGKECSELIGVGMTDKYQLCACSNCKCR